MKTFRFYGWGGANIECQGETVASALKNIPERWFYGSPTRYEEVGKEPEMTDDFDFLLHIACRFRGLSKQDLAEVRRIYKKYAPTSKRTMMVGLSGGSWYMAE